MPHTITVTTDDGTDIGKVQLFLITLDDADWAAFTAPPVLSHHNTILETPGVPAVAPIYDVDGVTIITPGVDAIPPVYRDPTENEAMAMLFEQFFLGMISSATVVAQQAVVPIQPTDVQTAAGISGIPIKVKP